MSTKLRWTIALSVLLGAVTVIAWRETQRGQTPTQAQTLSPQVVMFVDLSEEDEEEGCGAIIRAVRAASARGVGTVEVDARNPEQLAERYRLLSAPSVVFFDQRGLETTRLEGESPATIKQIRERLEGLEPRK